MSCLAKPSGPGFAASVKKAGGDLLMPIFNDFEKRLRQAGIKPASLTHMKDEDILLIKGIGRKGLAAIRNTHPFSGHVESKLKKLESRVTQALAPVLKKHCGSGLSTVRALAHMVAAYFADGRKSSNGRKAGKLLPT